MQATNFCVLVAVSCTTFWYLLYSNGVRAFECGRVDLIRERIKGGNVALRREWPFIVALYKTTSLQYICGGTLISNKHVLTAAHCIHQRDSTVKLLPNDVEVRLGAYNLTDRNESGVAHRGVGAIFVHSDWKQGGDKYDADIAILVLSENVTFTQYIQPVCMPAYDDDVDSATINILGSVVGWGLSDRGVHEDIPRQMVAEASNNSYCYREDPAIIVSLSSRSFCARGTDGSPKKGDSGGGFFAVSRSFWVQYGIVSAIRTVNVLAVYTNVKVFKKWIVDIVTESEGEVSEPSTNITLACRYMYSNYRDYGCELTGFDIRNEHIEVVSVTGEHVKDRNDSVVGTIIFESGLMYAIPNGLGKIFRNLKTLQIGSMDTSPLRLRHIAREGLKHFENLSQLFVLKNDIKVFDEDSLWDLPNLISFHIIDNKLKTVPEKTFSKNRQLRFVQINRNELESVSENLFRNNSHLEVVKLNGNVLTEIAERIFEFNTKLKHLTVSSNRLESVPRNLLANRLWLRYVDLSNNSLQTIDENFFATNFQLRDVNLSSNKLKFLPKKLFENNILLEVVDVIENRLITLDERTFVNNAQLYLINVTSNPLEYLPRNLFQNNLLLKWVGLSNNSLMEIPAGFFGTNQQLNIVVLHSTRLQSLPGNLFENSSVCTIIDFRSNSLTAIDEHIFESQSKLEAVSLVSNRLESLSGNLFKNNFLLDILLLRNNSLRTLPQNIFAMNEKLNIVDLSFNRLESVPSFRNCLELKHLLLNNNLLTMCDEHMVETNFELTKIDLSSNRLESLPKNLFKNNFLLESINLSNNSIGQIDEEIFATNSMLEKVALRDNRLEFLPRNLFKNNEKLTDLFFERNFIKSVACDFTKLKNVMSIRFYDNTCVFAFYENVTHNRRLKLGEYRDLTEFQNVLYTNCTITIG